MSTKLVTVELEVNGEARSVEALATTPSLRAKPVDRMRTCVEEPEGHPGVHDAVAPARCSTSTEKNG